VAQFGDTGRQIFTTGGSFAAQFILILGHLVERTPKIYKTRPCTPMQYKYNV